MNTLNQQIAEELGYFIATEDSVHITWIHFCDPDGYSITSSTFPKDEYFQKGYWEDFDRRFGNMEDFLAGSLPNWQNDLAQAVKLIDHLFDAPEGEQDEAWWNLEYDGSSYVAYVHNYMGYGKGESVSNPAEAFCVAWLGCAEENKRYWTEETK